MKAADLNLQSLINHSGGLVTLLGRRVVLHDLYTMAQFRKDLVNMVGQEHARRICTRMGFFWGQGDASALSRAFRWETREDLLHAGPVMHSLQGAARAELKIHEIDKETGRVYLETLWRESGEAEPVTCEPAIGELPCCWVACGYASGFASFCLGQTIYFIETQCRAHGESHCLAVGRDVRSWEEQGEELAGQLQYFQTDDIRGKIDILARNMEQKEKELAEHRGQLERAIRGMPIFPVEFHNQRFIRILNLAARVAKFESSVLITGETGVGKEVLARLIHRLSGRSSGPFVPVSCTALSETLIESELFGHKAGSFTGATHDQSGFFEEAQGGTIFLDEIGDINPNLQLKLLRVLQEHEVVRIGETRPRQVDVRVIAATNRELERRVMEGEFRSDLYYRLKVVQIELPPLRERHEDILPLVRHFLGKASKRLGIIEPRLEPSSLELLLEYPWPGNIRELENAVEHAAVVCTGGVITPEDLPPVVTRKAVPPFAVAADGAGSLEEVELEHIRRILQSTGGCRAAAARILGIGQATLYRKLKQMKTAERENPGIDR